MRTGKKRSPKKLLEITLVCCWRSWKLLASFLTKSLFFFNINVLTTSAVCTNDVNRSDLS